MKTSYLKFSIMAFFAICLVTTFTLLYGNSFKKETQYNYDNYIGNAAATQKPMNWPWRGVNLVIFQQKDMPDFSDIKNLKEMNVNFVCLRLSIPKYVKREHVDVKTAITRSFEDADTIIGWCKKEGIAVAIGTDHFPLDPRLKVDQTSSRFWDNQKYLNESINFIGEFVKYFDHWENVVGYVFMSEPVIKTFFKENIAPANWGVYFNRMRNKIRSISKKYIIYNPAPIAYPQNYKAMGEPIKDDKIIYSFHFFNLWLLKGKNWNINTIQKPIKIAYDWCNKNHQLLFCGSFGALANKPDRALYLKDILTVFNKFNISYAYWCYNGFEGWRYNYTYDHQTKKYFPSAEKTKTQKILEQSWNLNGRN